METYELINANSVFRDCPSQALKLYTKMLYSRHPVAYLNRSLCYLALSRPELAVLDAQRAYELGKNSRDGAVRLQLKDYAAECRRAGDSEIAKWSEISHLVPGLEATHPLELAKLSISEPLCVGKRLGEARKIDLFDELRVKALFRLALALWQSGGGAQRSALSVLERATLEFPHILPREFSWLGSRIAIDLQEQFDNDRATRNNGPDLESLMATRYTFLDSAHYDIRDSGNHTIDEAIIELDPSAAITWFSRDGKSMLIPTENIFPNEILFTEITPLSATTADVSNPNAHHICNTCSAVMKLQEKYLNGRMSIDSSPSILPAKVPNIADISVEGHLMNRLEKTTDRHDIVDDKNSECDGTFQNSKIQVEGQSPTPSSRGMPIGTACEGATGNVTVCEYCEDEVYWCSDECATLAFGTHHSLICGTGIEEHLRRESATKSDPRVPEPYERVLTSILLARILSWSQSNGKHPLQHPAIKLLSVAAQDREGTERVPWSYLTHVVTPLKILHAIDASRCGLAYHAGNDGKVINSLINLIERQLCISSDCRWTKVYDGVGCNVNTFATNNKDGSQQPKTRCFEPRKDSGTTRMNPAQKDPNAVSPMLFGKLYPLCGLLGVAGDKDLPNVELVDLGDNRIVCVPTAARQKIAKQEPFMAVIHKGEPLLLTSRSIRSGTQEEREIYYKKSDLDISTTNSTIDIEDTLMAREPVDEDSEMPDVSDCASNTESTPED